MHDLSASRALNRQLVLLAKTQLAMERFPAQKAAAGQTLHSAGDALTRLPIIERGCIEAIHYLGEEGNSIIPITFKAGELAFASALFSTATIKVDLAVAEDLLAHWVPIGELESRPDGRLLIAATHEHLAARSGVSRPKLSRELKQLERSGRLKLLRGIVEVLDPDSFTASRWNKRSP